MRVTPAYLTSVATFYDMFELEPVGRHSIYVCTNISCSLRGADALLEALESAADGDPDITIRGFECLGACDIAPMVSVDHTYYGPLELSDARKLIDDLRADREPLPSLCLALRKSTDPNAGPEKKKK
jgi:NADH:ubiquinone oxidoreductase subunit E